jgi:CheY-like chemotaxis protein
MDNNGTILLAEDNPDDVFMVTRALLEAGVNNPLAVVNDGQEAVFYCAGQGKYTDRERFPLPMLVLLDLDMPLMSGFDVLTWLRRQPRFKDLPVIVFTGSTVSPDVSRAYRLGANSFMIKPAEFDQLRIALGEAIQSWTIRRATDGPGDRPERQPPL